MVYSNKKTGILRRRIYALLLISELVVAVSQCFLQTSKRNRANSAICSKTNECPLEEREAKFDGSRDCLTLLCASTPQPRTRPANWSYD